MSLMITSALADRWKFPRLKSVVTLRTDRATGNANDDGYVGLENIEPWTGRLLSADQVAPTLEGEDEKSNAVSVFHPGDVLFGKLRPYLAKAFLANESGVCTTELLVMRPREGVYGPYLLRILLNRDFIERVNAETLGVKMPRADWDTVGSIPIPLPPMPVQRAIADYLDRETAELDALIAAKERLLALLAEKRRALITEAVTRGLEAGVPLRDSGVEWLGEIPAHWQAERVKFLIGGIDTGFSPQCYNYPAGDGEWGVLRTGCVNGGVFSEEENKTLPEDVLPPLEYEVMQGDVLMSRASGSTDLIGSVALVTRQPKARLLLSDKMYRLRLDRSVCDAKYFVAAMGAIPTRQQVQRVISGAEGLANNIAQADVREILLAAPPLVEQRRITEVLERKTDSLDTLASKTYQTIEFLHERRSALIAAAVTGQLQVVV